MNHSYRRAALLGGFVIPLAAILLWQQIAAEDQAPGPPATAQSNAQLQTPAALADTATLGGPDRYLTYLSTDKPVYRSGEVVYLRGTLLHHATRRPLAQPEQLPAVLEIRGPKGDVVASGQVTAEDSVFGFQWTVPDGQPGGQYTIVATQPFTGQPPAERKFEIRAYRAPRLKTQIKFFRDGYGPADQVAAVLHVERAEGGIPAGAAVTVTARVDGAEVFRGPATVDISGDCLARFQLPAQIARGEGTLAMAIEDGGVVETASKTIPILLQTVDLTLYPEGGELVAGWPNRVYFEAFTPSHQPADLAGIVIDQQGTQVAEFRSEHEGRGRFSFTPEVGRKYALKITAPSGIATQYALPEVKQQGAVLQTDRDVFAADEPVKLSVGWAPAGRGIQITLAKREMVVGAVSLDGAQQQPKKLRTVTFPLTASDPDGVLIATIWDQDGTPLAERLIYRQPAKSVSVQISADSPRYVPGGRARLKLTTRDEQGRPVDAVVGVTVTDDSVLEMIQRREQAPRLPVMVLLEGDVRELADAHVYLDAENPQAPLAVDLLLGTQGWRRFAFVETESFVAEHGDDARRVLALRMPGTGWAFGGGMGGGMMRFGLDEGLIDAAAPPPADEFGGKPLPGLPAAPAAAVERPGADADEQSGPPQAEEAEMSDREAAAGAVAASAPVARASEASAQGRLQQALGRADAAKMQGLMAGEELRAISVRNDFVPVRVYAHQVRSGRQPGERFDFTETLFWQAALRTGPAGEVTFEFGLNDAVSSFRVLADAFTAEGALGSGSLQVESVEPFYLEPKLPLEVTMDDLIRLPLGIVNATDARLDGAAIRISVAGAQDQQLAIAPFAIEPAERVRRIVPLRVSQPPGQVDVVIDAAAGPYADQVTRSFVVRPLGFPVEAGGGGLVAPGECVTHELTIPADLVRGSLSTRIAVYPTPLASLSAALERLIQEPCGCFEQTSSSTYPLVMAQQYFLSHEGVDPDLIERSSEILARGYERLTGFECPSGGYEWFGSDPGHDALTAYGLLEFTDMAQVRHVDPAMLQRTRDWLLGQRDGDGGYVRKTHTLHTWLAEPEVSHTYNTWALLEARVDADLTREIAWVRNAAERTQNTYVLALAANVLAQGGDQEGTDHLLDKLAGKQGSDGSLAGATTSVVGSGGEALTIETTALAVLAWLKSPHYAGQVERAIKYLAESCQAGRFGSTQSTVLALRAIVAYDQSRARPKAPGSATLIVDGKVVGTPVAFTAQTQGAIELPEARSLLAPGKHKIQLRMSDGSRMPYSIAVKYHRLQPDSSEDCRVHLEVALRDPRLVEGATTEAAVSVVNRTNETIPMPVAIIGLPGGLEVRHDQLKELVKEGRIAAYEVLGREIVLYWRALAAEERIALPLSLVAAIPGTYTGPASRAYLYYTDEHKVWVPGLKATIDPLTRQ